MKAGMDNKGTSQANGTSRATLVQAADPYFPHTPWRAVLWGTVTGLMMLGCVSIAVVVFGLEPIGWFQIGKITAQMVAIAGICYFSRGLREQILVTQGKIPERKENL